MVSIDKAQVVKLKSHGHNFEILVDLGLAVAFKNNNADISDVLAVPNVFSDAKKALEISPNAMKQAFGTEDPLEAAKEIIRKGDIPLSTEFKAELREKKLKQIINMIHRDAVDPKTHLPHPPQRIESALQEAKFHVDEFEDLNSQLQTAIKSIRPILPIRFETKEISIKLPPEYAAKSYSVINSFGKKIKEDWQTDGSLLVVLEIPGGLEEELHNKLNAFCHGNVETEIKVKK